MDEKLVTNIPLTQLLCSSCRENDKELGVDDGSLLYMRLNLKDLSESDEIDEELNIELEISEIEYLQKSKGVYLATAKIEFDCPCCDKIQTFRKLLNAPKLIILNLFKCEICSSELLIHKNNFVYKNKSIIINVHLNCTQCKNAIEEEQSVIIGFDNNEDMIPLLIGVKVNLPELKNNWFKLIRKNEFNELFKQMSLYFLNNPSIQNEIIIQESKYNRILSDNSKGILAHEFYEIEIGKIAYNLLNLISTVQVDGIKNNY